MNELAKTEITLSAPGSLFSTANTADASKTALLNAACVNPNDHECLGQAMSSSKREANGNAVEMVLKQAKASA